MSAVTDQPPGSSSGEAAAAPSVVAVLVDGTAASAAALRWAASMAPTSVLRVVTPYQRTYVPSELGMLGGDAAGVVERGARREAAAVVRSVLGDDAEVHHVVAVGSPARVLREHASDAALVVLGVEQARRWRRLRRPAAADIVQALSCPITLVPVDGDPT